MKYVKLAAGEDYVKKDLLMQARIYNFLGVIYLKSNLNDEAVKFFKKAVTVSHDVLPRYKGVYMECIAYTDLSVVYAPTKEIDSLYYYSLKSYKTLEKFPNRNDSLNVLLAKSAASIAGLYKYGYLKTKPDSSSYYFGKSLEYIPKNIDHHSFDINLYNQISKIYLVNGLTDEAKKYAELYTKYTEEEKNIQKIEEAYKVNMVISSTSKSPEAYNYLKKYIEIQDKVAIAEKKSKADVVRKVILDKDVSIGKKNTFLYYLMGFIILSIFLAIFVGHRIKNNNRINKTLLLEKQTEVSLLESKVNIAFEEVIELAKNNSPEFIIRFEEVYPNFYKNLLKQHPNIRKSEFTFCAYLFLGFSIKEIANYTFVASETVQMRRYRLRKKFNIPSDRDLCLWMKNLDTSPEA